MPTMRMRLAVAAPLAALALLVAAGCGGSKSAIAFARPGNFFESASSFFHWSEPRSLLTET